MDTNRMEAFSDGVLAIVITIMVLKLEMPKQVSLEAVRSTYPIFLSYILSYVYIAIYWTNHHHLLSMLNLVSGSILWKNLLWLFWMSLIPMATEWIGINPFEGLPTLIYGIVLFMCSISYIILQSGVIKINGKDSKISKSIGKDLKGKFCIVAYLISILFAMHYPIVSYIIYIIVALVWIVPDKRLEKIS